MLDVWNRVEYYRDLAEECRRLAARLRLLCPRNTMLQRVTESETLHTVRTRASRNPLTFVT